MTFDLLIEKNRQSSQQIIIELELLELLVYKSSCSWKTSSNIPNFLKLGMTFYFVLGYL